MNTTTSNDLMDAGLYDTRSMNILSAPTICNTEVHHLNRNDNIYQDL